MQNTKQSSNHWAEITEAGSTLGMNILLASYRYGGKPAFYLLLTPVIGYFYLFRRQARQASFNYWRQLKSYYPATSRLPIWLLSLRQFWAFGCALIDKLGVWIDAAPLKDIEINNSELIDTLQAEGKGGVLLISHLGNFEICQALSMSRPQTKITILLHTKHAKNFNALIKRYNKSDNLEFMQVSEITIATAIKISERVERGEFIAIAGDRAPINASTSSSSNPSNSTLAIKFLGRQAAFPRGPFILASILKAPIITVFCLKQQYKYRIDFEALAVDTSLKRKARIEAQAQAYARLLESQCLTAPEQWFNFFNFWSQSNFGHNPNSPIQKDNDDSKKK